MSTPTFYWGIETPTRNFKKVRVGGGGEGGVTGARFLERGAWNKGMFLFRGFQFLYTK